MSLFHVYHKYDSMDRVVVTAKNEIEALAFALRDGYLTKTLCVNRFDLTVFELPSGYCIKSYERHVKEAA